MTSEQKAYLSDLVEQMTPEIIPLLQGFTKDQAEEILQETYLAAAENIEMLMTHPSPNGWFVTVAHNRAKHMRTSLGKSRGRYAELPDRTVYIQDFQKDTIDEILPSNITPKDRAVLKLHFEEKLRSAEMGEELGITPDNARQTLRRAINRLKKLMMILFINKF